MMDASLDKITLGVRFVTPQDAEYPQICALRYRLFFQAHHLPFDILYDAQEVRSLHAVITHKQKYP